MEYANINTVYENVRRLSAKDERGFVTPIDFNYFAPLAQIELFKEKISGYRIATRNENNFLQGTGIFDQTISIKQDLITLKRVDRLLNFVSASSDVRKFYLPDDYAYYIDFSMDGNDVTIVDSDEFKSYKSSFLCPPSLKNPVGYLDYNSLNVITKESISEAAISYYKIPQGSSSLGLPSLQSPTWAYTGGSNPLYNPNGSINFELPQHLEQELTFKILSMIGITIRDTEVFNTASKENLDNLENLLR